MDEFELASALTDYLDSIKQPYNFAYILKKAGEIAQDFDDGIAQDPDYE